MQAIEAGQHDSHESEGMNRWNRLLIHQQPDSLFRTISHIIIIWLAEITAILAPIFYLLFSIQIVRNT